LGPPQDINRDILEDASVGYDGRIIVVVVIVVVVVA
jgi:hypothetical protein